jgi:hypothetical protein
MLLIITKPVFRYWEAIAGSTVTVAINWIIHLPTRCSGISREKTHMSARYAMWMFTNPGLVQIAKHAIPRKRSGKYFNRNYLTMI